MKKRIWTEEEVNILKEYSNKCHYTELTKVLPNRTIGAIAAKAHELGIELMHPYTKLDDNQIEYIKDNWGTISAAEIARNLKISIGVLNRYKRKLKLPNKGPKKKWTNEKIRELKIDAKTKNRDELSKKYKTPVSNISKIASQNNIKLIDSRIVWTDELIDKLENLINQGLGINEMTKIMNINTRLIRQQIKKMKGNDFVKLYCKNLRWTDDEVNKLISLSEQYTLDEISKNLNRNPSQVYNKALRMGIEISNNRKKRWTKEDDKKLIDLHTSYGLHQIAKIMNRSESTIRKKAKALGLRLKSQKLVAWSLEDEQLLREYASKYTVNEIANLLDRTDSSIEAKLKCMGIKAAKSSKFWTEEEEEELKQLASKFSIEEIANKMNKPYSAIKYRIYHLEIKAKNYSKRKWTDEEDEQLLELLSSYSLFEIAGIMQRSTEAIYTHAISLGYNIDIRHRNWTKEEETLLSDLWGTTSIENIAKKLNRTVSAIKYRVHILGLGSQIENNYDGLRIQDIADIFNVNRNVILISWVNLGLKLNVRKRSNYNTYSYVEIKDLYEFLEKNQNIWDSRNLEKNILGIEPEWLKEKRIKDKLLPEGTFKLESLNKQQLVLAKQYFLDLCESKETDENSENKGGPSLIKMNENKKR